LAAVSADSRFLLSQSIGVTDTTPEEITSFVQFAAQMESAAHHRGLRRSSRPDWLSLQGPSVL